MVSVTPERIWAKTHMGKRTSGFWHDAPILPNMPRNIGTEYVRGDIHEAERTARLAAEAERDEYRQHAQVWAQNAGVAEAALAARDAEIARLRDALTVIAGGKVPSYTSYQQWHDKYVACGIFARAALEGTP